MKSLLSRAVFQQEIAATFASPAAVGQALAPDTQLPDALHKWLSRLQLLTGVPLNYLVPDEGMLPPESIRFFYLDPNWTAALLDGAFSIGRNLVAAAASPTLSLDQATQPAVQQRLAATAANQRTAALGLGAIATSLQVVSGFLLRSSLVTAYPGLGVNVYPVAQPAADAEPLPILRFERLAPQSDTMLCLVDGDARRVEIHEAPEQLHYGLDDYALDPATQTVRAHKNVYPYQAQPATQQGATLRRPINVRAQPVRLDVSGCFRPKAPRTMRLAALAGLMAQQQKQPLPNSAELAFQLVEGVGQVSFIKP